MRNNLITNLATVYCSIALLCTTYQEVQILLDLFSEFVPITFHTKANIVKSKVQYCTHTSLSYFSNDDKDVITYKNILFVALFVIRDELCDS